MSKKSVGLVGLGVVIGVFGYILIWNIIAAFPNEDPDRCTVLANDMLGMYDRLYDHGEIDEEILERIRDYLDSWYWDNCDVPLPEMAVNIGTIREHVETLP